MANFLEFTRADGKQLLVNVDQVRAFRFDQRGADTAIIAFDDDKEVRVKGSFEDIKARVAI